jgi:hypothetical protein
MMGKGQKDRPTKRATRGWRRIWLWGGVAAVAAAVVVGLLAYRAAAHLPGQQFPDQGNRHVQTFTEPIPPYNSDPPTSGPHMSYVAPWGIHTEPVPRQLQVHNLEDGGVMVQYSCPGGCPELVSKLRGVVEGYDHQVILAPYPGMKTRIALTAWTRLEAFDEFDEGKIRRFIRAYRGIDHHPR